MVRIAAVLLVLAMLSVTATAKPSVEL